MAHLPKPVKECRRENIIAVDNHGEQLIMHTAVLDRRTDVHAPFEVKESLEHCGEYSGTTGCANGNEWRAYKVE